MLMLKRAGRCWIRFAAVATRRSTTCCWPRACAVVKRLDSTGQTWTCRAPMVEAYVRHPAPMAKRVRTMVPVKTRKGVRTVPIPRMTDDSLLERRSLQLKEKQAIGSSMARRRSRLQLEGGCAATSHQHYQAIRGTPEESWSAAPASARSPSHVWVLADEPRGGAQDHLGSAGTCVDRSDRGHLSPFHGRARARHSTDGRKSAWGIECGK